MPTVLFEGLYTVSNVSVYATPASTAKLMREGTILKYLGDEEGCGDRFTSADFDGDEFIITADGAVQGTGGAFKEVSRTDVPEFREIDFAELCANPAFIDPPPARADEDDEEAPEPESAPIKEGGADTGG